MRGVEIIFKDGHREWLDPIDDYEVDKAFSYDGDDVSIKCGIYWYDYKKSAIDEYIFYTVK